ncbi:FAR1 DNA-binding domain [Sesbania bispinosa]|nr:FAR1 DNA-binding domain [Sesbania bispinosa]
MGDLLDMLIEVNDPIEGFEHINLNGAGAVHGSPGLGEEESDGSNPSLEDNNGGYMVDKGGCVALLVDADCEETLNDNGAGDEQGEESRININSFQDMRDMNLIEFSPHEIIRYDFATLDVAFEFYRWYARMNGFCARRGKVISSKKIGRVLQQNFFCYREGKRDPNGLEDEDRQRQQKAVTRCNCKAEFRAHVDINTGRWKMTVGDVNQINNMLKVGIGAPRIFGSFANQSGGYEKAGFQKKDIYNQIGQQRWLQHSDATTTVKYLRELGVNDPAMFTRHTTNEEGRTTSRCEGLHSELVKFVHSQYNLIDFLQHFYQCVAHMRFKELEDDFASVHGDPVLETSLQSLEGSTAKLLTRQVFHLFRPIIEKASVLENLKMKELPQSVVLKRWTKGAKDNMTSNRSNSLNLWDAQKIFRCGALNDLYRELADLQSDTIEEYNEAREKASLLIRAIEARKARERAQNCESRQHEPQTLRDPIRVRHKGRGSGSTSAVGLRVKRTTKCTYCRVVGHNRLTCPLRAQAADMS